MTAWAVHRKCGERMRREVSLFPKKSIFCFPRFPFPVFPFLCPYFFSLSTNGFDVSHIFIFFTHSHVELNQTNHAREWEQKDVLKYSTHPRNSWWALQSMGMARQGFDLPKPRWNSIQQPLRDPSWSCGNCWWDQKECPCGFPSERRGGVCGTS